MLPSEIDGALSGVRVGAVLHPAVRLAFADRACFLQHGDRPAAQRPDRRPLLPCHQHRTRSCQGRILRALRRSARLSQGADSKSRGRACVSAWGLGYDDRRRGPIISIQ